MEVLRALATFAEPPSRHHRQLAELLGLPGVPDQAAYTDVFLLQLYPYASVYLGDEGWLGGAARDRVAGFFRALALSPPPEPDHLTVLLTGYASTVERERDAGDDDSRAAWRRARTALLWEHVLSWVPRYVMEVRRLAPEPYASWAALLDEVLRHEARVVGPAPELSLHLRAADGLPDPRAEGGKPFLDGLLAPVRTGMIITRTTLARTARDAALGLRIAERRYVLSNLLDQDVPGTLRWLAEHAAATAGSVRDELAWLGPTGRFWHERARASADLLLGLAEEAEAEENVAREVAGTSA